METYGHIGTQAILSHSGGKDTTEHGVLRPKCCFKSLHGTSTVVPPIIKPETWQALLKVNERLVRKYQKN